jgi:lactate racemase
MRQVPLPYGRESRIVVLPKESLLGVASPRTTAARPLPELFDDAWSHPIGIEAPGADFHPGERVVFVVSDHTRPPTGREILPLVLERLSGRIRRENVTLLIGTGTHRASSPAEIKALLGDLAGAFEVVVHDCDRDLVEVGTSARGTPIFVNRRVVEADHVVTLAQIGMHYYAGYSGGRKAILPGVAGRETIERNHALMLDPACEACRYEGNPLSEEMSQAAALVGVDFIVDAVVDDAGAVSTVVVGDVEAAHATGRAAWDARFRVEIPERADLVVVSPGGHPRDIDLYQAYKGLYNAMRAVRDGGLVLWVAACPGGLGHPVFADWMARAARPADVLRLFEEEGFVLGGHKAVFLMRDLERAQIVLCSELDDEVVRGVFLEPLADPTGITALARARLGEDFRALVLPQGTETFPVLPD